MGTTGANPPRGARTTVAIAMADVVARDRLVRELGEADDIEVVIELDSGSDLFERVHDVLPDVLLVSTDLEGVDAVALCSRLSSELPVCRVVLLYGATIAPYHAVAAGVAGAVALPDLDDTAIWTVRRTVRGEALIPAQWAGSILEDNGAPSLSATEREVLQRLAKGAAPDAVAALHEVPPRLVHLNAGYALAKIHRDARDKAALTAGE
jgi:two-component system response regulator DesR